IAVAIVGWRVITLPTAVYTGGVLPPVQAPVSLPAPPARQAVQVVDQPAAPPPAENCFAPKVDFNSSIPATLSVADGHLLVASFFRPGEPEQVSVLPPGIWRNTSGWTFGVTFEYSQNC